MVTSSEHDLSDRWKFSDLSVTEQPEKMDVENLNKFPKIELEAVVEDSPQIREKIKQSEQVISRNYWKKGSDLKQLGTWGNGG